MTDITLYMQSQREGAGERERESEGESEQERCMGKAGEVKLKGGLMAAEKLICLDAQI